MTLAEYQRALIIYEITHADVVACRDCASLNEGRDALRELQQRIVQKHRALVMARHPDVNQGTATDTDEFRIINEFKREVAALELE